MKKLYVGNISFDATEGDLQHLFSEAGISPDSVTLVRDRFSGQSRGFGFAEFSDDAQAQHAIDSLNGKSFMGRNLTVNEARPSASGGRRGGRGGGGGGGRGGYGRGSSGGRGGRGGGGRRDW
jgi:RNA recognition motif-containing protein